MLSNKFSLLRFLVILLLMLALSATLAIACTSILVGKDASIDGSVLASKNEDQSTEACQQIERVERVLHEPGTMWTLQSGRQVPNVAEEWAYVQYNSGFIVPETRYHYATYNPVAVNEWGVACGDNSGTMRDELKEFFPEAGIYAPEVKYVFITRGKTARESILAAGELVDKYGFGKTGKGSRRANGAMYWIADPNEGWWFEVTSTHWVAQRCPDDAIMFRANSFRIGEIDLEDTDNFLGSVDVVSNAKEKGYWDPEKGPFNWSEAYGQQKSLERESNTLRELMGLQTFAPSLGITELDYTKYPESMIFVPDEKVSKEDLMAFHRTHYEGTEYDISEGDDPHKTGKRVICTNSSVSASVIQLRSWLPPEVGNVIWRTQHWPCLSIYTPWYLGITDSPDIIKRGTDIYTDDLVWWRSRLLGMIARGNYKMLKPIIRGVWDPMEKKMLDAQDNIEVKAVQLLEREGVDSAREFLTNYCASNILKVNDKFEELLEQCITINAIRGK